jgi:hypothetical protein
MPSSQEAILAIARFNSDNVHHAQILVAEDVTVEDEVAKIIPTEVDTERDAGEWVVGILVPEWNLDHVEVLAGDSRCPLGPIQLEIILRFHEKIKLMEVEFVVFGRAVLDGPFFDRRA